MQLHPTRFVERLVLEASGRDRNFVALGCEAIRDSVPDIWSVAKNQEDGLGHCR